MNNTIKDNNEYQEKIKLKNKINDYYQDKVRKLHLDGFSRIKAYLPDTCLAIDRDLVFAHLDFEPITEYIAQKKEFTVISGLNPSSPLHLGHKVLFDFLLYLQKIGANIFIPITNDESYLDGKVKSLKESRQMAYEEIIPSIIAFGFDPEKTKIYVDSDYPDLYNFAIKISRYITNEYVQNIFGEKSFDNSGKAFYRSAVQLAQILLPQLEEFGGIKNSLIPVGIDQHPYICLARDVAKKMKMIAPSEVVLKFAPSVKNPSEKMSGSKPETAIFLNDAEEIIKEKIDKAFTGSVSTLEGHHKYGAVPEACSVFALLYFQHPDNQTVADIYEKYKKGKINTKELKNIITDIILRIVLDHQKKKTQIKDISHYLLHKPLRSFL